MRVSRCIRCMKMWLSVSGCIRCIQMCPNMSGSEQKYYDVSERIWTYLNVFKQMWMYLGVFECIPNVLNVITVLECLWMSVDALVVTEEVWWVCFDSADVSCCTSIVSKEVWWATVGSVCFERFGEFVLIWLISAVALV